MPLKGRKEDVLGAFEQPYPRPDPGNAPEALKAIVAEFVVLVRAIRDALRAGGEARAP